MVCATSSSLTRIGSASGSGKLFRQPNLEWPGSRTVLPWRHDMEASSGPLNPDAVHDRESLQITPSSPFGADAGGWENITIEQFLDAALAWAESTDMGVSQGLPAVPSWRAFAVFLWCGKVYE